MKTAREFAIALAATDLESNIIAIEERDREIRSATLREAARWVDDVAAQTLRAMADGAEAGA